MVRRKKIRKEKRTAIFSCLARMKSAIDSRKDSISSVYNVYAAFCKETTLHGLKHTVQENLHGLERFLWLVLTVCAFAGAVFCALSQYNRYNSEPVVVSMQRDYRSWWTTFPAVTACYIDRVEPERAKEVIQSIWNVSEESDIEKFQYYRDFVELVAGVSFRDNLQNFWKFQSDDTVQGIDLLQLALSVHPANELKVMISHVEETVDWHPVMTEVGMCLTFNSVYAKYQFMLEDSEWRPSKLLQCHYHSGQCFVRIDSIDNAVRYFIHSPYEISTAISNPTGEISPGDELIIDFKVVEIQASPSVKNLRPEQRRCRFPDEWLSNSIEAYSFALCQMHCRSRMAMMFCGCRPYFHVKGDGDVCDAHGMACVGRNVEILINIPKNLAKCACLPQCAEFNYYSHTKKVVIRQQLYNWLTDTVSTGINGNQNNDIHYNMNGSSGDSEEVPVAAIRINLMPPKFRLHRDVIFTLEDLFASLGGTTALFVGASVLTVVETILFIIRNAVNFVLSWSCLSRQRVVEYKP